MKRSGISIVVLTAIAALAVGSLAPTVAGAEEAEASASTAAAAPDNGIVAYYFHGNKRCSTCRKLEAYSKEAITGGFASELENGELEWLVVNTDEKANAHFVTDFELVTKSVVLVEYRDGEVVRFKNLKLVWQLVGDQDGFIRYVRDETADFIAEG
ncbi:MAG: nitrophenyl compound nitroreductase subunit ArsF family protein [Candidatus Sulfomarinibacteraceae bacterium]